jgi:hypothetical protein
MGTPETEAVGERGSEKFLRARSLPEKELKRLFSILNDDSEIRLIDWLDRGQPAPDAIFGAVTAKLDHAGVVVDKLVSFNALRLRLDVFPYGTPVPDEILIRFQR